MTSGRRPGHGPGGKRGGTAVRPCGSGRVVLAAEPSTAPRGTLKMAVYPRSAGTEEVPAQPNFPALERDVLAYWQAQDTFRTSVQQRPADDEFVFYDGPPFANGLPHYGHL